MLNLPNATLQFNDIFLRSFVIVLQRLNQDFSSIYSSLESAGMHLVLSQFAAQRLHGYIQLCLRFTQTFQLQLLLFYFLLSHFQLSL
jgi:hypothetical protein